MFLASADGHVIHFPIDEINILSGVGKGVMGIKLDDDDTCLGGALGSRPVHEAGRGDLRRQDDGIRRRHTDSRPRRQGLRGGEAHASFVRVVPPPIELVDWDRSIEEAAETGRMATARTGSTNGMGKAERRIV